MAKDLLFKRSPKEAIKYYYIIKVLEFILSMVIATVVFFLWSHFNWWHFILYLIITFIVLNILYTLIT
ncbi:PH domain-containing protein, partial [Staphylococcus succinus]